MQPLISIIVPVYNVERFLERCVDSICNQTYKNIEIILVDDGSKDSSSLLCDKLANKDSRIRVLHKENGGLSSARNAGIDLATGKFYTFVDSDDYLLHDAVEYLYHLMKKYDVDISVGNFIKTYESQVLLKPELNEVHEIQYAGKEAIEQLFTKDGVQMVTAWGKLYKAKCFAMNRYPEGMLHEDEGLAYKLYYEANKVVVSDKEVYAYYFNPNSITKKLKSQNYMDISEIYKEQLEFFEQHNEKVLANRVRNKWCVVITMRFFPKNYFDNLKNMKRKAKKIYSEITDFNDIPRKERIISNLCMKFPYVMGGYYYFKYFRG